jgi:hypothetical protein
MALKSGQMSGLDVPQATLKKVESYLDSCQSSDKGGYGYMPGTGESATMTAVGLLCRQYLGVSPRNPGLLEGVKKLKANPPGTVKNNYYYDYYATQVMHHMGNESWEFWNLGKAGNGKGGIRDTLIDRMDEGKDTKHSHQYGSWAPEGQWSVQGGRIMSTSLALLTLEVYYRHLPLYRRDLVNTGKPK